MRLLATQGPGTGARVPSQETLNIVLADDHEVVRGGLKLLLETEPDFEVVAEAGDIDAARRCVREHHPKVLVLDLNMPGKPVLEAIPGLRKEAPDTQIVVLTMRDDVAFVREAREAGALGYVLKGLSIWLRSRSVRLLCVAESATSWGITVCTPSRATPRPARTCRAGPHLPTRILRGPSNAAIDT